MHGSIKTTTGARALCSLPRMMSMLLIGLTLSVQSVESYSIGIWISEAVVTTLTYGPNNSTEALCALDPILPSPACVLCWDLGTASSGPPPAAESSPAPSPAPEAPPRRCDTFNGTDTILTSKQPVTANFTTLACQCGPDPFLSAAGWIMCKCPQITVPRVPDSSDYTLIPAPMNSSPAFDEWAVCQGPSAICSFANCTLDYPGKKTSDLGQELAACGCVDPNPGKETNTTLGTNYVDPSFILSKALYTDFQKNCPNGAQSAGCSAPNSTNVCKAIVSNTIYGGQYDVVSTFSLTPELGTFDRYCPGIPNGQYVNCMTAACERKVAFDGSPLTCYCPIYKSSEPFIIGAPNNESQPPCVPKYPFILSGAPAPAPNTTSMTG